MFTNGYISKLPKVQKPAHGPALGSQFFLGQIHYGPGRSRGPGAHFMGAVILWEQKTITDTISDSDGLTDF